MKQVIKWVFFAFLILSVFFSCTQTRKNTITGTIEGLEAGQKIVLASYHASKEKWIADDSVMVKKVGEFTIQTSDKNENVLLFIASEDEIVDVNKNIQKALGIFLEGLGKHTITGTVKDFSNAKIQGGVYDLPEKVAIASIEEGIDSLRKVVGNIHSKEPKDTALLNDVYKKFDILQEQRQAAIKNYINTHSEKIHSSFLLLSEYMTWTVDTLEVYFNKLSENAQKSFYGKKVSIMIANVKSSEVGMDAPDFKLTSIVGDTLSVSSFKGKPLVLEFWASWCKPCRSNNPHLVALYNQYNPKGLEILGVATWDKDEDWRKAVEEDALPWQHVNTGEKFDKQQLVSEMYVIKGVPHSVLISAEGKILWKGHPSHLPLELKKIFGE